MDSGTTAWILTCTALVLVMTPGLAFFYAGMVRSKNALGMLMQNYISIAVVSVTWLLVGYSLAFGTDVGGLFGGMDFLGGKNVVEGGEGYDLNFPPAAFMMFQLMFATLTAALLTGAVADRMKFGAFVVVIALWSILVYPIIAHWAWAPGGLLLEMGVLDFAGGQVVEICSGASALALAIVLGRRRGWPREGMHPHNLPLTMLGAGLLWFGWIAFNAGSALAADGLAASAALATHMAGSGGMIGWLLLEKKQTGHATTLGAASGAVAGLVAITPAAGYIAPLPALVLGVVVGAICLKAIGLKNRFNYDDSLDVVGVHYVGGVVGMVFIGLFASVAINDGITNEGLFLGGGFTQLGLQIVGSLIATAYAFGATFIIAKAVDMVMGLRVSEDDELEGLDSSQHAEKAYDFGAASGMGRF